MEYVDREEIGKALWELIKTDEEIYFNIVSKYVTYFLKLLAKQNFCRIRIENDEPQEVLVFAVSMVDLETCYFHWLKDGQEQTLFPEAKDYDFVPIRDLALGEHF